VVIVDRAPLDPWYEASDVDRVAPSDRQ
jgi:hypothetical protein